MLQMDLPHINVLSKIDKLHQYDPLPFNLDFYTEVQDLNYLIPVLEQESPALRSEKFGRLNQAIADLVQRFGLVSFEVLAVENKKSMMHLLRVIDRAGGYVFGAEGANDSVWQVAMRNESSLLDVQDLQDRWIDNKEFYDELERKEEEEQAKLREEQARAQAEAMGGNDILDALASGSAPTRSVPDSGIKVVRKKK